MWAKIPDPGHRPYLGIRRSGKRGQGEGTCRTELYMPDCNEVPACPFLNNFVCFFVSIFTAFFLTFPFFLVSLFLLMFPSVCPLLRSFSQLLCIFISMFLPLSPRLYSVSIPLSRPLRFCLSFSFGSLWLPVSRYFGLFLCVHAHVTSLCTPLLG